MGLEWFATQVDEPVSETTQRLFARVANTYLEEKDLELRQDVMEVFSPPRLAVVAQQHGLVAQLSCDIKNGYDLAKKETKDLVKILQRRHQELEGRLNDTMNAWKMPQFG